MAPERLSPTTLRFSLAGGDDVAGRVQDLADRETKCCAFFTFVLTKDLDEPGGSRLHLDVSVPTGREEVLDGLGARADAGIAPEPS